jgi:hypothetical protein
MRVGKVNVSRDDGETEYGTIQVPEELVREAIQNGITVTTRDDSLTIAFGHIDGLVVHMFFGEGESDE